MASYLATNRLLLTELILDKYFKRPNEYNVFNKTFFVKYTPKPLNDKASPVLNLSSKNLSNGTLERGAGGMLRHYVHTPLSPLFRGESQKFQIP
jgi:hypothetical protein